MKRTRFAGLVVTALAFTGWTLGYADEPKPEVSPGETAKAVTPSFATPTEAINFFIRDGYKKAKIATPAAKSTDDEFLRRAFIDLIGRVATYEEVIDYQQDNAPNKRARLVNRLIYGVANKDNSKNRDYIPRIGGQPVKVDAKTNLKFDYPDLFGQNWANLWTIWLMTRTGHPLYREQMRNWLEGEFITKNTNHRDLVIKLLTASGKSNGSDGGLKTALGEFEGEGGAVNFIIHHLGEATPAPEEKRVEVGPFDAVPITSRVTRLFLGVQTNCTQCHDHPFNKEWTQADFWGVNAFFRQTVRDRTPTGGDQRRGMDNPAKVKLYDDGKYNNEQIIFYERRDGKLMASKPNFLKDIATAESGDANHKPFPKSESKNRREVLADYVTRHDNFARAYVNRIWGHLFGRGLNKEASIDDFGSHNEVVHPELLDYLANEFVKSNYDPKKLLEWIGTSEAYSLSHVANATYNNPKYDAYFARMPLKALAPEVLFESLETVTRAELASDRVQRRANRETFEAKLVKNFGDDEGNEMTFNGTVVQALLMMNGSEVNEVINSKSATNPVSRIVAKHSKGGGVNSAGAIEEIFITVLNRKPTTTEMAKINAIMHKGAVIPGEKPAAKDAPAVVPKPAPPTASKTPKDERKEARDAMAKRPVATAPVPDGPRAVNASNPNEATFYQDLFWALLNTNEFMLNH